jgi:hypothetical protein
MSKEGAARSSGQFDWGSLVDLEEAHKVRYLLYFMLVCGLLLSMFTRATLWLAAVPDDCGDCRPLGCSIVACFLQASPLPTASARLIAMQQASAGGSSILNWYLTLLHSFSTTLDAGLITLLCCSKLPFDVPAGGAEIAHAAHL